MDLITSEWEKTHRTGCIPLADTQKGYRPLVPFESIEGPGDMVFSKTSDVLGHQSS